MKVQKRKPQAMTNLKMMNQAKILKKMRTQKKVLKQPKIQIQKIRLIRKALRLKAVSTVNKNVSNASEAQKPSESSKSTGNKDFDEVFKDNKLDILLSNDMKRADTTEAMSETLAKYEKLWLAEAENANNKLQASSLSDEEKESNSK